MNVTDTPQGRERATTILVAEDDDALRGIVTRVFWDQGFRTLEARHGGEALHLAELAAPYLDLVVTDVIMPEVDGLELGRRLAQRWASIPILYISAYPPNLCAFPLPSEAVYARGAPRAGAGVVEGCEGEILTRVSARLAILKGNSPG